MKLYIEWTDDEHDDEEDSGVLPSIEILELFESDKID
jgi:hypothetical protein